MDRHCDGVCTTCNAEIHISKQTKYEPFEHCIGTHKGRRCQGLIRWNVIDGKRVQQTQPPKQKDPT